MPFRCSVILCFARFGPGAWHLEDGRPLGLPLSVRVGFPAFPSTQICDSAGNFPAHPWSALGTGLEGKLGIEAAR